MNEIELFSHELSRVLSTQSVIKVDTCDIEQKITQFEQTHHITLPVILKQYYRLTGKQSEIYQTSDYKVYDVEHIEVCNDEELGEYLVFASRMNNTYGFFLRTNTFMHSSAARIVWGTHHMGDLKSFLLYSMVGTLISCFENVISVKLSYVKVEDDDYPNYIAEKISVPPICSIDHVYYTAFCNAETRMLAFFNNDSSPKLLLGCDDYDALSAVMQSQKCTLRKKDGYRVQNPAKYVKGEPPMNFSQKMDMISQVNFPKIARKDVTHPELPESLQYLHEIYSKKKAFFDSDMHVVKITDYGDEPYQVIADENQYGFSFAIKCGTKDVYITYDGETYEPYEASLEDVLLYISCVQGMGLLAVNCIADPVELDRLRPYFFEVCRNDQFQCFVCPDRRMLMIYEDNMLSIAGKTDRYIHVLEEDSGVEFSFN